MNIFLKHLINKRVKIKYCERSHKKDIWYIDISTSYSHPEDSNLLSQSIIDKHSEFLEITKNKSNIYKIHQSISKQLFNIYDCISDKINDIFCDFLIDNVVEEKITTFISCQ